MRSLTNVKQSCVVAALALALVNCGGGGPGSPQTPTGQANLSANVLQLAVGTANLFGTSTGLNVVVTYRQPLGGFKPGASGALVSSPTLVVAKPITAAAGALQTYDATSTVTSGPGTKEIGGTAMTSTSQVPGSNSVTTFGQSGGAFGLGIEPFNATAAGDFTVPAVSSIGQPFQVAPYIVPLYDPAVVAGTGGTNADPNAFVPWGGPPAFLVGNVPTSIVGNTLVPKGTAGVSEGLDVFQGIAPVASGTYTLTVSIPANTGTVTQSQSFSLPAALHTLGTATAPSFVPDAKGGGTFTVAMPSGATEAYLQITDYGPASGTACNTASTAAPVYYTLETTASGALVLPDALGPNATPSVCTASQNAAANAGSATPDDQISIQLIGFDYPVYEMSYPKSLGNPSPAILGPNGEADLTISSAICQAGTTSCTGVLPLVKARIAAHR